MPDPNSASWILWAIACAVLTGMVALFCIGVVGKIVLALYEEWKERREFQTAVDNQPTIAPNEPVIRFTKLVPDSWRNDSARMQWAQQTFGHPYMRDMLGLLQGMVIVPPMSGFDATYELGRLHGVQLAIKTMLSLSTPMEQPDPLPPADYGAEEATKKAGVDVDPNVLAHEPWEPVN